MIIVDTDILIDAAHFIEDAVNCLQQIEDKSLLAISVVTSMEMIIGCRNKKELTLLDHFFQRFEILNLDNQISDKATVLLKTYRLKSWVADSRCPDRSNSHCYQHPIDIQKPERLPVRFIDELDLLEYPWDK